MEIETLVDFVNECKGEWQLGDRLGIRLKLGEYAHKDTFEYLVKKLSEAAWIPEPDVSSDLVAKPIYIDKISPVIDEPTHWSERITYNSDRLFAFLKESADISDQPSDQVKKPKHYEVVPNVEAKDIIKLVLNSDLTNSMSPWQISCFKDVLKYRLRAGKKDNLQQDIDKAEQYVKMGWPE